MSTFSSDRIANIIVPDLQKRFRRGYIDYFNRKDKTYRPVEEVQIRSIVPLEQFEELMKLLDDHKSGKALNMQKIWSFYTFILWYEQFFVLN